MPAVGFLLAAVLTRAAWLAFRSAGFRLRRMPLRWRDMLAGAAMIVVPLVCTALWVRYADRIKAASPLTEFASSASLHAWNFTTWAQISNWRNWMRVALWIRLGFMPGALLLFPLAAIAGVRHYGPRAVLCLAALIAAAVAMVALHFNLYVCHDYYEMAISPYLAVLFGLGLHYVFCVALRGRTALAVALVVTIVVCTRPREVWDYLAPSFGPQDVARGNVAQATLGTLPVGEALARVCAPGEWAIVTDSFWSSEILYYARRKGLLLRDGSQLHEPPGEALRKDPRFTTVACTGAQAEILGLWQHVELRETAGPYLIYRVANPRP